MKHLLCKKNYMIYTYTNKNIVSYMCYIPLHNYKRGRKRKVTLTYVNNGRKTGVTQYQIFARIEGVYYTSST